MNTKIRPWLLLPCLTVMGQAREFKSPDGGKTVNGEFIRYSTGTGQVTLRLDNGRDLVAAADKFSKEDYEYFIKQQKAVDKKTAIEVDVDKKSAGNEAIKRGNIEYKYKNSALTFSVKNTSGFSMHNLTLNYWVVIDRDNKGKATTEIVKDTKKISSLGANDSVKVEGPTLKLTQGAVSKCKTGCPKVAASAARVDNDRIVGTKIQIIDAEGDTIYDETSSNRVQSVIGK